MIDRARSILTENTAPDVDYRWSANPYRGCALDCAFCYARGTHEYSDLDPDRDWATKIAAKEGAPALLRAAFDDPRWRGEPVLFSAVTDPYQPLESTARLTRSCLEVCLEYRSPVSVVTKSASCVRDLDLFARLAAEARFQIDISLAALDALEPGAPSTAARLETISTLSRAGLDVGVLIAPVILGTNDAAVPDLLARAAAAGASRACWVLLRTPEPAASIFARRAPSVRFDPAHTRGAGTGPRVAAVDALFATTCRRVGLAPRAFSKPTSLPPTTFRRPPGAQLALL